MNNSAWIDWNTIAPPFIHKNTSTHSKGGNSNIFLQSIFFNIISLCSCCKTLKKVERGRDFTLCLIDKNWNNVYREFSIGSFGSVHSDYHWVNLIRVQFHIISQIEVKLFSAMKLKKKNTNHPIHYKSSISLAVNDSSNESN